MCRFRFVFAAVAAAYLLGAANSVRAAGIQFIAEPGWVLPEAMTYVSSFGTLKNQLLIPDPETGYLYGVPAGGGASKTFATFGTPSSYFGGEGTGLVYGGVIVNSGPLAGDYLGTGSNYTNPATGAYSGAIFTASPSGATQVVLQTTGGASSATGGQFLIPTIAPNSFGKFGGQILVAQDVANAIQIVTPTSASSVSLSTFAHLTISPFGELFAPTGFGSVGGDLLVSGLASGTILAINSEGVATTFANIALETGQAGLREMAIAPTGFGSYGGDLFVSVAASTQGGGVDGAVDIFSPEGRLLAELSEGTVGDPFDPRGIYFLNNTQVEISDADPGILIASPSAFTPVTAPEPGAVGLGAVGLLIGLVAYSLRTTRPRWICDFNGRLLRAALLFAVPSLICSAGSIWNVDLNTGALIGNSGSFALDFQLVAGGSTVNTARISQFSFGSGEGLTASASSTGGVALTTAPLSATFTDAADFFSELILPFRPGAAVQFQVDLSGEGSVAPDAFTIAILDTGNEIPTTNPDGALVEFDYTAGGPTVITSTSNLMQTTFDITSSVTAAGSEAAPESSSLFLGALGLALCMIRRGVWRRSKRRIAVLCALLLVTCAAEHASAQYNITLAVGNSTPRPGGGTFNPVTGSGGLALGASFDGGTLLFVDNATNAIWKLDTLNGKFSELIAGGGTLPDGFGTIASFGVSPVLKLGTLAFVGVIADGSEGIYTMPVGGGAVSRVADANLAMPDGQGKFYLNFQLGGGANSNGHIFMDGAHIAFDSSFTANGSIRGTYAANLDGSGLAPLTPNNTAGLLCFLFNPYSFSEPAIWGTHFVFQGSNVFDDYWFWTGTYPPGVLNPPVPACNPGGPLNYPAAVSPGAVLPGGVLAGQDNQPYTPLIDDTQIYLGVSAGGGQPAVYSISYNGGNLQPILDPDISLAGLTPPYSIVGLSADSGSLAMAVNGANGDAIYVYRNGVFHRVAGSGDVIAGITVPASPPRLGLNNYALSGGSLTFALFNTAHFIATPTYCADIVTGSAAVTVGGLRFDHASGRFLQTVTVENKTTRAMAGPVALVLKGLPAGVSVANASGVTSCSSSGQPLVVMGGGAGLGAGDSVAVTVAFEDPRFTAITWTAEVVSGANP